MPALASLYSALAQRAPRDPLHLSQGISAGVIVFTFVFFSLYLGTLYWTYRQSREAGKPVNAGPKATAQKYAPCKSFSSNH
jgi:hypothetical protein